MTATLPCNDGIENTPVQVPVSSTLTLALTPRTLAPPLHFPACILRGRSTSKSKSDKFHYAFTGNFSHNRNPPMKAWLLSPSFVPGGTRRSFLALPPPITTLSATSAALSRATTSSTNTCHLFLPSRSNPHRPT